MKRQRKQYSVDLKAKTAVEAIEGQRTIQEIAFHYEVHPTNGHALEDTVAECGGRRLLQRKGSRR
jgi:hypothetical protein